MADIKSFFCPGTSVNSYTSLFCRHTVQLYKIYMYLLCGMCDIRLAYTAVFLVYDLQKFQDNCSIIYLNVCPQCMPIALASGIAPCPPLSLGRTLQCSKCVPPMHAHCPGFRDSTLPSPKSRENTTIWMIWLFCDTVIWHSNWAPGFGSPCINTAVTEVFL